MPKLIRFYITHCIIGFGLAAVFTGAILWLNVANLWHLISTSDIGLMAVIVFWVLNGIVFAGAQCTVAILLMAERDDDDDEPRGGRAVPVRVAANR
ncbi:hypothetical protein [Roseovarius nanhaiticus]|uniref:Uncharacterized protein n=1 Tax=Roseovarius nanhaiticus TaxID=573024 RepID=A0A1N7E9W2_9RHOB|nr:hypothetical protein [Roseovarius nanhaiticus]SEK78841.1 hypothetical protein SAMN05216208_2060 [Roseovarius nanhaiticus]SIR84922.1 hypothetical protein SAMN05421666_0074 [Roseovarius nanhaiticus]